VCEACLMLKALLSILGPAACPVYCHNTRPDPSLVLCKRKHLAHFCTTMFVSITAHDWNSTFSCRIPWSRPASMWAHMDSGLGYYVNYCFPRPYQGSSHTLYADYPPQRRPNSTKTVHESTGHLKGLMLQMVFQSNTCWMHSVICILSFVFVQLR
jgi:hypothetical protein